MKESPEQRSKPPRQRSRVRVDPVTKERVDLAGKRCALYLRVSTSDQDPEHQELALRWRATMYGLTVTKVYADAASGAKGVQHRPMLQAVLRDAASKQFDLLLIWSLDRLSREGTEASLGYLRQLREAGVRVVSANESWLDTDLPIYEVAVSIIAWTARREREMNSERTKAAYHTAKAQGKRWGRKPTVTESDIAAIKSNLRRQQPASLKAMAQQLGLSVSTVHRVATRHHWKIKNKPGRRRVTDDTILAIRTLLRNDENGLNYIRKKTGAGLSTIIRVRDTLGPLPSDSSAQA
jgi:DNA invertase Pin-like site-specific DNA recombinase